MQDLIRYTILLSFGCTAAVQGTRRLGEVTARDDPEPRMNLHELPVTLCVACVAKQLSGVLSGSVIKSLVGLLDVVSGFYNLVSKYPRW